MSRFTKRKLKPYNIEMERRKCNDDPTWTHPTKYKETNVHSSPLFRSWSQSEKNLSTFPKFVPDTSFNNEALIILKYLLSNRESAQYDDAELESEEKEMYNKLLAYKKNPQVVAMEAKARIEKVSHRSTCR